MKLPIFRLFFLFLFVLGLASCSKDSPEPEPEAEPTTTDLLVAHEWQGKAVMVNGMDVSEMEQVKDMILDIKNTRFKLNREGTYTSVYSQAGTTHSTEGTWALKENETVLHIDVLGDLSIKKLTATEMILTQSLEFQGMRQNGEVVFEKRN